MEIEITFSRDETEELIKAHVLKEFPINTTVFSLHVIEKYGEFIVRIKPITELEKEKEL